MPTQVEPGRTVAVTLAQVRPLLGRVALSLGLAGLFVWLLWNRLADVDVAAVGQLLSEAEAGQWLAALLVTAVSFWAVGHYDAVLHRHFGTRIDAPAARLAGVSAIAVSQTLGLGVITGAIVRWRMLPGVTLSVASKLTVAVALSFLAGWAVVTAGVLLALPDAPFRLGAALTMAVATGGVVLAVAAPHRWRRHVPNLFTLTQLIVLAAVDTLAAAVALYVLLPAEMIVPMSLLLPAFLLALGVGLVSGAPGGIGAFEVTLLSLMPTVNEAPLLAAVLAWRLVYFAVPACLGALVAAKGPMRVPDLAILRPRRPAAAEAGIADQGEHRDLPGTGWLVGRTPHLTVALFDPAVDCGAAMNALARHARQHGTMPAIYKCGARMAVTAPRGGLEGDTDLPRGLA